MLLLLCLLSCTLWCADDMSITVHGAFDRAENEELAEVILHAFFQGNGHNARDKLRAVMSQRVRDQDPHVRQLLFETYERSHGTPSIGEDASEEVSNKVFELLTESIEGALAEEENDKDVWKREAKQRCKKATVAAISTVLGLAGAAIGAAVAASIESARCNC